MKKGLFSVMTLLLTGVLAAYGQEEKKNQLDIDLNMLGHGELRIGGLSPVPDEDGGFDEKEDVRKLSMAALICGLALESETFLEESHHDKLTKLKNRMGFYSDFARNYAPYMEPGCDKPMSMFICDIDKFKSVNDTYGHNAGDDVLAFMAGLLSSACSDKDSAYRWGGEEFIMIMRDADLSKCVEKAEALRQTVMHTDFPADGNILHLTVSFGCRQFDPKMSIEDNISEADKKLYDAKENGRNQVRY